MSGQRWDVMSMQEYEVKGEKKTKWTRIGTGWTNKNGSINVDLECFPRDGRLQLQIPLSKEQWEQRQGNSRQQGQQRQGGQQQRYRGTQNQPAPMPSENLFGKGPAQPREYEPEVDGEPEY
jgi:hypothetical protein